MTIHTTTTIHTANQQQLHTRQIKTSNNTLEKFRIHSVFLSLSLPPPFNSLPRWAINVPTLVIHLSPHSAQSVCPRTYGRPCTTLSLHLLISKCGSTYNIQQLLSFKCFRLGYIGTVRAIRTLVFITALWGMFVNSCCYFCIGFHWIWLF